MGSFSGSAVIILFLEMSKILEIYLFDMPKFKEITYLRTLKITYLRKLLPLDAKVFGTGLIFIFFMAPKFCTTLHHLKSVSHWNIIISPHFWIKK